MLTGYPLSCTLGRSVLGIGSGVARFLMTSEYATYRYLRCVVNVMLLLSQLSVSQSFLEVLWNRTEQNFIRCSYITSITIRITDTILKKNSNRLLRRDHRSSSQAAALLLRLLNSP